MSLYSNARAKTVVALAIIAVAFSAAAVSFGPGSSINPFNNGARAEGVGPLDQSEAAQMAANLGDAFLLDTLSSGKGGGEALLKDGRPYTTGDLESVALRYDEKRELWVARWELAGVSAPNWEGAVVLTVEIAFDNGGTLRFADAGLYNPDAIIDEKPANPGVGEKECQPLDTGFGGGAVFCYGKD